MTVHVRVEIVETGHSSNYSPTSSHRINHLFKEINVFTINLLVNPTFWRAGKNVHKIENNEIIFFLCRRISDIYILIPNPSENWSKIGQTLEKLKFPFEDFLLYIYSCTRMFYYIRKLIFAKFVKILLGPIYGNTANVFVKEYLHQFIQSRFWVIEILF